MNSNRERLLTVMQQVANLKQWHKLQQSKLLNNSSDTENSPSTLNYSECGNEESTSMKKTDKLNNIDEQPILLIHENFEKLLEEKLKDSDAVENVVKAVPKRAYLKKGEGTSRFKINRKNNTTAKDNKDISTAPQVVTTEPVVYSSDEPFTTKPVVSIAPPTINYFDYLKNYYHLVEKITNEENSSKNSTNALRAFEQLEEEANDSSFCSTSSMVERLMEDSIKSTPVKRQLDNVASDTGTSNNSGTDARRTLDIINEETSKLEDSSVSKDDNVACIVQTKHGDSDDSDSSCSCGCDSQYMSTSVSIYAEETTVYSPLKSGRNRSSNVAYGVNTAIAEGHLNADSSDGEESLKKLLALRLQQLDAEIGAFRDETARMTKLRAECEKEYETFFAEKRSQAEKMRLEHTKQMKEFAEERKKLDRERSAFERQLVDSKNRTSRKEREEIKALKEEIQHLKEGMNKKESRWAAAQARIRTEMKQLKDRNLTLMQEIEKLQKNSKKVNFAPNLKKSKSSSSIVSKLDEEELSKLTNRSKRQVTLSESIDDDSDSKSTGYSSLSECSNDFTEFQENDNRVKQYADGRMEVWFPNGNVKKISADGDTIKTIYYNGDVKEETKKENIVRYYYAENRTWHTEYDDGIQIIEFPDGQVEKLFPDGTSQITYPNGDVRSKTSNEEKLTQNDGTIVIYDKIKDEKSVLFPNGQVETHTSKYKKREFPDGTVKIIHFDGIQETRYANGRVRMRTKDGRLLSDTGIK